jgi:hypothetical protein
MAEKHEKGLEFEKKVAEFFRKKGYNKVLLRERVPKEIEFNVMTNNEITLETGIQPA